MILEPYDTIFSGGIRHLDGGSSFTIRTENERFVSDSIYKHHDWKWDASKLKLTDQFNVPSQPLEQNANFISLSSTVIRNELLDGTQINGGTIQFRDPWYLHSNGTQPDSFFTYNLSSGPFKPTGAYNQDSGGVFFDQGGPDPLHPVPPYHSVRVPQTQTIGSIQNCNFMGWSVAGLSQVVNPPSLESPVIFKQANDTVKARYKGHLISSSSAAVSPCRQQKIVQWYLPSQPHLSMVYESSGLVFGTYSTDRGTNWTPEYLLSISIPPPGTIYRNPTIHALPDNMTIINTFESVHQEGGQFHHDILTDYPGPGIGTIDSFSTPTDQLAVPVMTSSVYPNNDIEIITFYHNGDKIKWVSYFFNVPYSVTSGDVTNTASNSSNYAVTSRIVTLPQSNIPLCRYCIVWEEAGSPKELKYAQIGPQYVEWSTYTIATNTETEINSNSTIAVDNSGNVMIAWIYRNLTTGESKIKAQKRNGSNAIVAEYTFATTCSDELSDLSITDYRNCSSDDLNLVYSNKTKNQIMCVRYYGNTNTWSTPFFLSSSNHPVALSVSKIENDHGRNIVMLSDLGPPYSLAIMSIPPPSSQLTSNIADSWNMVSMPNVPLDNSTFIIWPTAVSDVSAYEVSYVAKSAITNGLGYWAKFSGQQDITYTGIPLNAITIPVNTNWNMIGSISSSLETNKITYLPVGNVISDYFNYINGGYQPATTIEPGRGYWVKVNSSGCLTLEATSPPINQSPPSAQEPPLPSGAPSKPKLLSPDSGAVNQPISLTFSWYQVDGATSYRFQLSTSSTFSTLVVHDSTLITNSKSVSSLSYNTSYYWRVKATNENGSSYWSNVWKITTTSPPPVPPPAPLLSSPANNSIDQNISLYLSWNSSTGATQYRVQASRYSTFSSLVLDYANLTGTSSWISSLSYNTKYYWRVNASNSSGTSAWSTVWNFTTMSAPPPDPCPTYTSYAMMDAVVVSDSLGNEQTLYLRNKGLALGRGMKSNEEMPPEPQPGLFHAKFHSGKFLETIKPGKEKTILPLKIRDAVYPLTIRWDIKEENLTNHRLKIHDGQNTEDVNMSGVGQTKVEKSNNGNKTIIIESSSSQPPCDPQDNKTARLEGDEITTSPPPTPTEFELLQNTPNPFNPTTEIRYELPEELYVVLKIYDVLGQEIRTLVHETQSAGYKTVTFDGSNLSSGVYYYRIDAASIADPSKSYSEMMKMILVK